MSSTALTAATAKKASAFRHTARSSPIAAGAARTARDGRIARSRRQGRARPLIRRLAGNLALSLAAIAAFLLVAEARRPCVDAHAAGAARDRPRGRQALSPGLRVARARAGVRLRRGSALQPRGPARAGPAVREAAWREADSARRRLDGGGGRDRRGAHARRASRAAARGLATGVALGGDERRRLELEHRQRARALPRRARALRAGPGAAGVLGWQRSRRQQLRAHARAAALLRARRGGPAAAAALRRATLRGWGMARPLEPLLRLAEDGAAAGARRAPRRERRARAGRARLRRARAAAGGAGVGGHRGAAAGVSGRGGRARRSAFALVEAPAAPQVYDDLWQELGAAWRAAADAARSGASRRAASGAQPARRHSVPLAAVRLPRRGARRATRRRPTSSSITRAASTGTTGATRSLRRRSTRSWRPYNRGHEVHEKRPAAARGSAARLPDRPQDAARHDGPAAGPAPTLRGRAARAAGPRRRKSAHAQARRRSRRHLRLAVRVRSVAFDKGTARFALETVGEPRVGERRPKLQAAPARAAARAHRASPRDRSPRRRRRASTPRC